MENHEKKIELQQSMFKLKTSPDTIEETRVEDLFQDPFSYPEKRKGLGYLDLKQNLRLHSSSKLASMMKKEKSKRIQFNLNIDSIGRE